MKIIVNEEFIEDILHKFSYTEAKTENIQLKSIKEYIDKFRGRRGRKNKLLQIIDDLDKLDSELKSDAIKYAGLYLKELKTSIEWTSEDIINAILTDINLTKKYVEESKGKTDIGNKDLGRQLAEDILAREDEKLQFMQELYKSMKSGTHKMIHQLKEPQLKEVFSAIIRTYKLNEALLKIFYNSTKDKTYKLFLDDLERLTRKKTEELNYSYINNLISGLIKISFAVKKILNEDKPKGYEVKVKELENLQKTLQNISGENYMLWPESDIEITKIEDLDKYFKEVEDYRKDAEQVIKNYSRRAKDLKDETQKKAMEWNDVKINNLVKNYIQKKDLNTSKGTLAPHVKDLIKVAEEMLIENPSLLAYYKVKKESDIDDLVARIATKITKYVPFEVKFNLED